MKLIFLLFIAALTINKSYACSEYITNEDEYTFRSFLDVASQNKNVVVVKFVGNKFFLSGTVNARIGDKNLLPEFEVIRVIKGNITDKIILVDTIGDTCYGWSRNTFKINSEYVFIFRESRNISTDKSVIINMWVPEGDGLRIVENNSVSHVDIRTLKDKREINISIDYLSNLIANDASVVPFKTQEEYNKSLKDAP